MILFKIRRERENIIVSSMIRMYCSGNHASAESMCDECKALAEYASIRLIRCIYGENKPVCKECAVHCYSPAMREQMRRVMRWSGPRMMYRHPLYAIIHIIDSALAPSKLEAAKDK
ncbi:MAG TPA: nitrous oxide-stimulated promoter family protein [Bacteroidales bacterium]|nr:nitrous oxide-stimulated promoter family protein [Bacteroidales bacterium]